MNRRRSPIRILFPFALAALLLPLLAEASSTTNTRINRVRTGVDGRTYINMVTPPGTPDCAPGLAAEDFVFFSNTQTGRVLYAQVLTAYTTQALVDVFGDGTCYTIVGPPPFSFVSRWENISSIVIHP